MNAHTVLVHWCRTCHSKRVAHREDACGGCLGDMDVQLDPITRWPATPPRPGRWARMWAWLENHIPELGDFDEENE
jgi:hypothetical protein